MEDGVGPLVLVVVAALDQTVDELVEAEGLDCVDLAQEPVDLLGELGRQVVGFAGLDAFAHGGQRDSGHLQGCTGGIELRAVRDGTEERIEIHAPLFSVIVVSCDGCDGWVCLQATAAD